jgi:saccharopine dehydrogenase-like NADP-dependent oxidoreductase
MQKILILGAGLSSTALIKYLLEHSVQNNWKIRLADASLELAQKKIGKNPNGEAIKFDAHDEIQRSYEIKNSDLVISMLPARMHYLIATDCLTHSRNLITASYVSDEMQNMHEEVLRKNILFLNEIGVDPGIDHMSAMRIIEQLRKLDAHITSFESHTGGLIAPKNDNNPWNYKFTWNPRNVVLAGQGGARFLHNSKFKYIPYHKIFNRYERIYILDMGEFESYPNRDSLKYQAAYGLQDVETMFRGTIRRPGYCRAWDILVRIGATDDSYVVKDSEHMSYIEFIDGFLAFGTGSPVEQKLANYVDIDEDSETMYKLRWLGLFSNEKIGLKDASPAQILQHLLSQKWKLEPDDKDMVVMQHQFEYEVENKRKKIYSSMVFKGLDAENTAMSMSVGLPVAIAARLLLTGKIVLKGVQIPLQPEIYDPVLKELETHGIRFIDEIKDLD